MRKVRAAAVIVGAVIIAVLSWAYPAQATEERQVPTVRYVDTCRGVQAVVANPLKVVLSVKFDGRAELAVKAGSTGLMLLPRTHGLIHAKVKAERGWVPFGSPHRYVPPKGCRPLVRVDFKDNCDGSVTVTIRNLGRVPAVVAVSGSGDLIWVPAGATKTVVAAGKDAGEIRVAVKVGRSWLPVGRHRWCPPKDCPTPTPTPTATATATPTATSSPAGTPADTDTTDAPPVNRSNDLPLTGPPTGAIFTVGAGLVLAGAGSLWWLRRRREPAFVAE